MKNNNKLLFGETKQVMELLFSHYSWSNIIDAGLEIDMNKYIFILCGITF